MISMDGVASALIARNSSWVRQEAAVLARKLPSNVERADLIQVGLIAVAQAALGFRHEVGDADAEEAREAFVRYARARVRGAMLDELRGMDVLPRGERRKIKVVEIARERWLALHGRGPTLAELSEACGLSIDEVAALEHAALRARPESLSPGSDDDDLPAPQREPATARDEVEARVDTALLLRRLERFFARLPETDRQVIDAYLGVGMTPVQLADSLSLSPSRIAQMYASVCRRIAIHMGHAPSRAMDRGGRGPSGTIDHLVDEREAQLARAPGHADWGTLLEDVLTAPARRFHGEDPSDRIVVGPGTRWG